MEIQLRAEQAAFVQELVAAGYFPIPEEVIVTALSLLKDQYELYKIKRDELRKLVAVGVEQLDAGQGIDGEVVFRKLREKIRQRSGQSA